MTELTGILAEIADVVGVDAVWRLMCSHGGRRVRIPATYRPGCWLEDTVGEVAAKAIIAHFRVTDADDRPTGLEVVLPIGDAGSIGRARRAARIAFSRAMEDGCGVREAAKRAGVTERAGWNMRKRMRQPADDSQGSLF